MKHLIVSREYPPAPYPPGGIGTYVQNVSRLLAECGEEVHVIAQRWRGAPAAVEELCGGRLVVHRTDEEPGGLGFDEPGADERLEALLGSPFPNRWFSWRAARLAERLVEEEGIDVIEAQEWEAPLYDFQLRRALGLGPRRSPPCIVHLHSPTEFIFLHNGWDLARPDYLPMKRLEDYTIAAADARLAPSRFLARQCEERYGFPAGSITVLAHPVGDGPVIERSPATWSDGTICYVGRLEPRKGVVEWVEAAVQVLADHPEARLELIGADLDYGRNGGTVKERAERQIPDRLRDRFAFRGVHDRAGVRQFLAGAWAAVVPSRWENFPYTCIEAMASGLPVIASRRGGMADMLEDGRSGWLAPEGAGTTLVEGLQDALERALATPPDRKAEMGREAAAAIRRMCDNATAIRKHIDFRAQVAGSPARSSVQVPSSAAFARLSAETERRRRKAAGPMGGLAVVVVCMEPDDALVGCLESLRRQTLPPCAVALVVGPDCASAAGREAIEGARMSGWLVVEERGRSAAAARKSGIAAVHDAGAAPGAWVFVDSACRLRPECLEAYHHTLDRCPEVGLVSSWQRRSTGGIDVAPDPAFPYQWLVDDALPSSAFRDEALREAGGFRRSVGPAYQEWDAANGVLASGWTAVTYPAVLSDVDGSAAGAAPDPERLRTWRELLENFPDWVGRDASELLLLQASGVGRPRPARTEPVPPEASPPAPSAAVEAPPAPKPRRPRAPGPRELLHRPLREQVTYLATALRHPRRAASWVKRHFQRVLRDRTERARRTAANQSR